MPNRGKKSKPDAAKPLAEPAADFPPSLKLLAFALLIFIATLAVYSPAIRGEKIWDDDGHITKPQLQSWAGLEQIWFKIGATQQYYPLVHTTFWIEHKLWGDWTKGYHIVNILLHALSACLVVLVLQRLKIRGAMLAGAVFALHPVMVESVAWISELKNTQSTVFYLMAMLAYLHFDASRDWRLYALAFGLFILGLLSKTVTATLPAALLVIFWWQRGRLSFGKDVIPLIPFVILGLAAGLFTARVEREFIIGAEGGNYQIGFLQSCLIAGRAVWFYFGKLLWPARLMFIYPRWDVDPGQAWQFAFPLAAILATAGLALLYHKTRAPLAAFLFFVGTLFPALGFFKVYPFIYSFVADHFQYPASLGIITLVCACMANAWRKLPTWSAPVGSAALLAVLAILSYRQAANYGNAELLYTHTIKLNPACWMAQNNLGEVVAQSGRFAEAIVHYEACIKLKPDSAKAYNNLGIAQSALGQNQQAINSYKEALKLTPDSRPVEQSATLNNLAWLYATAADPKIRDGTQAVQLAERAMKYSSGHSPEILDTLAAAYAEVGRINDAIDAAQRAVNEARAGGQTKLASEIQDRLNGYRLRQKP